ncbi:DUF1289 domain-containing protein [Rhodospirillaceae bacterium KN72]|uniref:DUF1289 domain-containing protein n=1 Tax=Pacificispira spongiicola TaxID=2729598 RepID=A0A7Y0E2F0_9PROT|nr:DUF1289 domain-containing protein [Pacificispira spongiicola]NMM45933.1 DUF1289 domain-containing protein [Pacificispira spongiicola]
MAQLPNIPSPCVGICRLDGPSNECTGCLRTIAEIREWGGATNERRFEILQVLKQRRIAAGRVSDSDLRPRRRRQNRPVSG